MPCHLAEYVKETDYVISSPFSALLPRYSPSERSADPEAPPQHTPTPGLVKDGLGSMYISNH